MLPPSLCVSVCGAAVQSWFGVGASVMSAGVYWCWCWFRVAVVVLLLVLAVLVCGCCMRRARSSSWGRRRALCWGRPRCGSSPQAGGVCGTLPRPRVTEIARGPHVVVWLRGAVWFSVTMGVLVEMCALSAVACSQLQRQWGDVDVAGAGEQAALCVHPVWMSTCAQRAPRRLWLRWPLSHTVCVSVTAAACRSSCTCPRSATRGVWVMLCSSDAEVCVCVRRSCELAWRQWLPRWWCLSQLPMQGGSVCCASLQVVALSTSQLAGGGCSELAACVWGTCGSSQAVAVQTAWRVCVCWCCCGRSGVCVGVSMDRQSCCGWELVRVVLWMWHLVCCTCPATLLSAPPRVCG